MKYQAIIFDWDGTLGMTLHIWLEAYRSELQKLGIDLPDDAIVRDFFYEHNKTQEKYPQLDFAPYLEGVRRHMERNVPHMKLYPGAREILETLKENNIILTVVSSSPHKLLKEVLDLNNLSQYFSVIAGFDDVMKHKPDPEPFLNILEIAKLDPKTTIVIGDSYTDVIAARGAGLDSCIFFPKENEIFYDFEKLKATNSTYWVENLKDFSSLVLK